MDAQTCLVGRVMATLSDVFDLTLSQFGVAANCPTELESEKDRAVDHI